MCDGKGVLEGKKKSLWRQMRVCCRPCGVRERPLTRLAWWGLAAHVRWSWHRVELFAMVGSLKRVK